MRLLGRSVIALHAAALWGRAAADENDYKDDAKACERWYAKPVVSLCHNNFPDDKSEKLWIILFTSHACPECHVVRRPYVELAKQLEGDPSVAVAVVNCYYRINYRSLCSPRHQVDVLPALRIVEKGKFNITDKKVKKQWPRHDWDDIDRMVKEAVDRRAACPQAEAVARAGAVIPLCEARFPAAGGSAAQTWLVLFYSQASPSLGALLGATSEVAMHLGNGEKAQESEVDWASMKKLDRLMAVEKEYGLKITLPADGPFGYSPFARVGAVCCDCAQEQQDFCARTLGGGEAPPLPLTAWIQEGERTAAEKVDEDRASIMEFAMSQLGFLEAGGEL